jgi:DNA polymerase III subunit epsilon
MIETVLILDTETTGLDPEKGAKLIEVGLILYSVTHHAIIQQFSTLFPCDENKAEDINHISAAMSRVPKATSFIGPMIIELAAKSDAIIAHNAQFDKKFMATLPYCKDMCNKLWICTKNDFNWPVQLFRKRLSDICKAMDVSYVDAHRALADCDLIAKCFNKVDDLKYRLQGASRNNFNNSSRFI